MNQIKVKTRILRFFWGIIPWVVVGLMIAFVISMGGRIRAEKTRVDEERKASIKKEISAVRVITLQLESKRLEDKLSLPAEVEPYEDLWVKDEVPGQVVNILVDEGQYVKQGQVLVELDDRDYRSRLERIEALYKLAKLDHERYTSLARQKIAAESKLDEIEARLKELSAQRREAKLALSRSRITAPISGRLNEIKAKKGDYLLLGQPVLQILQFSKVKVNVGVPESDVAAVIDLKRADVIIEALENRKVEGRKVFLARQPRSLARLYDLELMVSNPDGKILPGMFAKVELVKEVYNEALMVPLYAIISQGEDRFVYVEKSGRAEKRPVRLGVLSGWQVQILEGLKAGERVIVVGHRFLDDGQSVQVMRNVTDAKEILAS